MSTTIHQIHFHGSVYRPVHVGSGNIVYAVAEYDVSANRKKLLEKVNNFWIKGVLKSSLHDANLIDLDKEVVTNVVDHTWQDIVYEVESKAKSLPTNQYGNCSIKRTRRC